MGWKFISLLALGLAAGCSSLDTPRCISNAECGSGFCEAGRCVDDVAAIGDTDTDAGDTEDTTPDIDAPDTGPSDAGVDTDGGGDTGLDADAETDADADAEVDAPDGADDADADLDGGDAETDVPLDCDVRNACGGCAELENDVGAICGPCGLDQYECSGMEATVCSGSTACLNPTVLLDDPEVLGATRVTLRGELVAFGPDASEAEAHGFCYSSTGSATAGAEGSTCIDQGATSETGPFEEEIDGLTPGTEYRFRAFLTTTSGVTVYSAELRAPTFPAAPPGVSATRGTNQDVVLVEWAGSQGAEGYRVYRDDELLGTTETTALADVTADAAAPARVERLDATQGTRNDGVLLTWPAAAAGQGTEHRYHVIAFNRSGDSEPSDDAFGFRGSAEPVGYQVRRDEGDWLDVDGALEWLDTDAPAARVQPGPLVASKGENANFVSLALPEAQVLPGDTATWEVRPTLPLNSFGAATAATGFRGAGAVVWTWEWSPTEGSDGSAVTWTPLTSTPAPAYDDTSAPAPDDSGIGETRWYRARADLEGLDPAFSSTDFGFRAIQGPPVLTVDVELLSATSAEFHGDFGSPTTEPPRPVTGYGFCLGNTPNPALGGDGVLCNDLGARTTYGPFVSSSESLTEGTEYHVRAWAEDASGLAYGRNIPFTTPPGAVTNFQASDGTFADRVLLTWDPTPGATSYEILQDEVPVATVNGTSHAITNAPPGTLPGGDALALTASQGTFPNRVLLQWNGNALGTPGEARVWEIRALNEGGAGPPRSDDGFRAAPVPSSYRLSARSSAAGDATVLQTLPAGSSSWDDTTAPEGSFELVSVSASEGTSFDHIAVALKGSTTTPGAPLTYTLTALGAGGEGEPSNSVSGFRSVGTLNYAWERRTATESAWVPLDFTTPTFEDPDGAVDPLRSLYRVTASATGVAEPRTATSNPGYRTRVQIVSLQSGAEHTCALLNNGEVRCWGRNNYGQLGIGSTTSVGVDLRQMPPAPALLGGPVRELAVGLHHNCAIRDDHAIVCWGRNQRGQLGDGTTNPVGTTLGSLPPTPVPSGSSGNIPQRVSAGSDFSCAAVSRGSTWGVSCWGSSTDWRLGLDPDTVPPSVLVPGNAVTGLPDNVAVTHLVSGRAHTCAVQNTRARCWGANNNAQLYRSTGGQPGGAALAGPSLVTDRLGNITHMDAGGDVSCAIHEHDRAVRATCWGDNRLGQLGIYTGTDTWGGTTSLTLRTMPLQGDPIPTGVSTSGAHTCVTTNGGVYCAGANGAGQLARGNTTNYEVLRFGGFQANLLPSRVEFVDLSTGATFSCFQAEEGIVQCYGAPSNGQLGNGSTVNVGVRPEQIPGPDTPVF